MKSKICAVCIILFSLPCLAAESIQELHLSTQVLPAKGSHSSLLSVQRFGRYAVTAHSKQGVALQYVDRMAGPSDITGSPGEKDGRLDLFLNQGEYKIVTYAHENGTGEVKLTTHRFNELNSKPFPQLVELKSIKLTLNDFQQRSFWLHITQRKSVVIEAAGRNLADMRLWKDGNWLLDATPVIKQVYPHPNKPLQIAQLNTTLEPGLYLLTAYGGPSQPWTVQSDAHPLYIRYGIPRLAAAGEQQHTISVFGTERYLVPGNSNYFHLSVPEATAISISAQTYQATNAFDDSGDSAQISKKSIPPATHLELDTQPQDRVVTVTATAGQPYRLQHFEKRWQYNFRKSGQYWLSTIHSGNAADSVDATSVLTHWRPGVGQEFTDARAVSLDSQNRYQRRFNLLDTLTLYLRISEAGKYVVAGQGEGVQAKYRVEPFLTFRPASYKSPPFRDSGHHWDLDPGLYVLTVDPELKGILTLTIEKQGYVQSSSSPQPSVAAASRYGQISLDGDSYTLYLNQQPGVAAGVILRSLPIDLSMALPVMQLAGETLTIPVSLPDAGTVQAVNVSGTPLEIAQTKGHWTKSLTLDKGRYEISIHNSGDNTQNYSLQFSATRLNTSAPLPPIDKSILHAIPNFPALTDKHPEYLDLDRHQPATFLVKVHKPALYRLESSGLLQTEGNLRTRTIPSLVRQQANGVGRNFLIQQYLREGDYQLTLQPQSNSRGHLGLSLARTAIEDGGLLSTEVASRATLKAGKGLAYRFSIKQKGRYRLRAIGLGRTYVSRVEDADGWPIIKPNVSADITRDFEPGDYRIIIHPEAVSARVVTTLKRLNEPTKYQGHGPHSIGLDQEIRHEWLEPPKDLSAPEKDRITDRWLFELPATADTTIALTKEMQGKLVRIDVPENTVIASVSSVKPWQGALAAGHYQLAVNNVRHSNHVNYQLKVSATQLLAGLQRHVTTPVVMPVAVGDDGFTELSSYGQSDVRAALYDAHNVLVARNDDRSNDWNFLIAQSLPAGKYTLHVDAVNGGHESALVSMRNPNTQEEASQSLPLNKTIKDTQAHIYPLKLPAKAAVLVVQADSADAIGVSLEASDANTQKPSWKVLGSNMGKSAHLLLPLAKRRSQTYRLRVWSADRRGAAIALQVQMVEPIQYSERQARAVTLTPLQGGKRPVLALAKIALIHPGVFKASDDTTLLWSSQAGHVFTAAQNGLMPVSSKVLLVAKQVTGNHRVKLNLSRVYLRNREQDDKDAGDNASGKLHVLVPAGQTALVDIGGNNMSTHGPLLVVAQSRVGQAGVELIDDNKMAKSETITQHLAVAQQTTASIAFNSAHPMVKLWNASDPGQALEVSVRQMQFKRVNKFIAKDGDFQYSLSQSTALALAVPAGLKRVNLVLPAYTAAALIHSGNIVSTHWSGKTTVNEIINADIDKILVLNAAGHAQDIRLVIDSLPVNPSSNNKAVLVDDEIFQRHVASAGLIRIPVRAGSAAQIIRVRGSAHATYIQNDGRILQGRDLRIFGDGVLLLNYKPGVMLVWLESHSPGKKAVLSGTKTLAINTPQSILLKGKKQTFRVNAKHGMQLLLRSDSPLITRVEYANGKQDIEAHPNGVNTSLYLPTGKTTVQWQGLGSGKISGVMFVSSAPIVPLKEGFGPDIILNGGASRLYGFEAKQTGPVGLGVQASADVVSGLLMDESGKVVGRGVVQMPQLTPGHYIFQVSVPANSLPVHLRPALVGIKKPPGGPPLDVIKKYLNNAGLKLNR